MSTFLEYLASHPWQQPGRRYNEPIMLLYRFIERAFRSGCDHLTLTPSEIVWSRAGQRVNQFPIDGDQPDLGWQGYLDLILQQDTQLQQHVQLESESPASAVYRLLP